MGKSTKVEAPATPDYAAANREGVMADIETLPIRLAAEQAAAAGTRWTNPVDGKTYDFGLGTDWAAYAKSPGVAAAYEKAKADGTATGQTAVQFAQNYYNTTGRGAGDAVPLLGGDAAAARRNIESALQYAQGGADISRTLAKQQLQDQLELAPQYNALNLQSQRDAYTASLEAQKQGQQQGMDLELQYRPKYTESELAAQKAAWQQSMEQGKQSTYEYADWQKDLLPQMNALGLDAQRAAYNQGLTLADQGAAASQATMGQLNASLLPTRDAWGKSVQDELAMGSKLTAAQQAQVENDVRSGQAARGNILGNAAMINEAMAKFDMGQKLLTQRQAAAKDYVQGSNLVQVQQPSAQMTSAQAVNPLMPNFSSGQMQTAATPAFSASTVAGANLSPYAVNQSNGFNYLNANAGQQAANFAQQSYGTQANIYSTQQQAATAKAQMGMDMMGTLAGGAMSFI